MADKALADGSANEMIKKISGHMATAIKEKFTKVVKAQKNKDKSVEAGRFVEAYVLYMHYVEGIHTAIMSASAAPQARRNGTGAAALKTEEKWRKPLAIFGRCSGWVKTML